jgi:RNA-directed DNA polymerase
MNSVIHFLQRQLKLDINPDKSQVVKADDCEFLGFIFKNKRIVWSDGSLQQFKYNIRRLTSRSWGISMPDRIEKLSAYIRGWMNYYALSKYYRPLPLLDEWIRRRVRMRYMKQWRKCRTKVGKLIALGAAEQQAIAVGISSKGHWKLARTYGSQSGLTNSYLKEQGLVSVRELWIAFHYPNG